MADYYCQFSTTVKAAAEALDWLEQKLNGHFNKDDDEWDCPPCEFRRDKPDATELYVWSEEAGDVDRLVEAVREMQTMFSLEEPWSLTWADTCSKPYVDSFHGGALVCYKGKMTSAHSLIWVEEMIKKILEEGGEAKSEAD